MDLGKKLYELRKNKHYSQEQLAEKLGVSRQTVSNWELNQTTPDLLQAKEIANFYQISLDELVGINKKEILTTKVSNVEKLAGIIIKMVWIYCPKWFSSVLYIAMGWLCIIAFGQLLNNLTPAAFIWLLIGGILYTVGGVIYALKLPVFNALHKNFGSHEIFHVFVMAGSFCHFMFMFLYVANMPLSY